jgi:adenosylhomocysteinase
VPIFKTRYTTNPYLQASLQTPELRWERIRAQVEHIVWPNDAKRLVLIAKGRRIAVACSNTPSFVLSVVATTHILTLTELHNAPTKRYRGDVYLVPKRIGMQICKQNISR